MYKPKNKKSKEIWVWVTALSLTSHVTSSPLSIPQLKTFFLNFLI